MQVSLEIYYQPHCNTTVDQMTRMVVMYSSLSASRGKQIKSELRIKKTQESFSGWPVVRELVPVFWPSPQLYICVQFVEKMIKVK